MPFDTSILNTSFQLFGTETPFDEAAVVVIPVPWDLTSSYRRGSFLGPQAILQASFQLDFFDPETKKDVQRCAHLLNASPEVTQSNLALQDRALAYIRQWNQKGPKAEKLYAQELRALNQACQKMCDWVEGESSKILAAHKIPGLIGGEHSTALGNLLAVAKAVEGEEWGVLQIDAHADLRLSYQGFEHSHASVMRCLMDSNWAPTKLVQVALRDICEPEWQYIQHNSCRLCAFFDADLKAQLFNATPWHTLCEKIIAPLPKKVYISFDIDGLQASFCPHTGTPVPGGLSFSEAIYLLNQVVRSGRKIVGFDLCEVAPASDVNNEWDGNVGARLLLKLCASASHTAPS